MEGVTPNDGKALRLYHNVDLCQIMPHHLSDDLSGKQELAVNRRRCNIAGNMQGDRRTLMGKLLISDATTLSGLFYAVSIKQFYATTLSGLFNAVSKQFSPARMGACLARHAPIQSLSGYAVI